MGSFNPSGDGCPDDPDILREIGDQDAGDNVLRSIETYYPWLGMWLQTSEMIHARNGGRAELLANGDVLITGGHDDTNVPVAQAEIHPFPRNLPP